MAGKKPAPKEIRKLARFRDEEGNAIDKTRQGKLKTPMGKAVTKGPKAVAYKGSPGFAKGGMVKGGKCPKCGKSKPCMACGGMTKGKK